MLISVSSLLIWFISYANILCFIKSVIMEPTASGIFCNRMLSMVNSEDVNAIIQAQRHMWVPLSRDLPMQHIYSSFILILLHVVVYSRLDRFEKTNEMLINFNGLSNVRLQQMNEHFLMHTRTLIEMKKDLDSIFRRIRYYIQNLRHH